MHNRRESHGGDSGTRPSELSRRSFISVGVAAGLSVVGFSSVGLAGPAFAAPGNPGEPRKVVPFGPVEVVADDGTGLTYARAVRLEHCEAGTASPAARDLPELCQFALPPLPQRRRRPDLGAAGQRPRRGRARRDLPAAVSVRAPRAFGGLPKGTLLFSCNYWPFDFTKPFPFASTNIQLYASRMPASPGSC